MGLNQYQPLSYNLVTGLQIDFMLLITTLKARPFSQPFIHLTACLSSLHINILWQTVSKLFFF